MSLELEIRSLPIPAGAAVNELREVNVDGLGAEELVLDEDGDALDRVLEVLATLQPNLLHLLHDPVAVAEALVAEDDLCNVERKHSL